MENTSSSSPSSAALRQFTASPNWWSINIWGGGHTQDTDPTQRGWKAGRPKETMQGNPLLILVGRRGVKGCFSVLPVFDGKKLDVLVYDDETPEEIIAVWAKGEKPVYSHSMLVDNISGWGLEVIQDIERLAAPAVTPVPKFLCTCSCKCKRELEDKNSAFCRGCTTGECGDYYLSDEEYYKTAPQKAPDCPACGAGGMGDAYFDAGWVDEDPERPGFQLDGRCMQCGTC